MTSLARKFSLPFTCRWTNSALVLLKEVETSFGFSLSPFHNKSYTRGAKPANVSSSTSLSKQYVCGVWQQAPCFYSNELAKTVTSLAESQGQGVFGCHPKH